VSQPFGAVTRSLVASPGKTGLLEETMVTPEHIKAITRNLREFGYDLEESHVQEAVDKLVPGESPKDIIGKFAKDMLVKAGVISE